MVCICSSLVPSVLMKSFHSPFLLPDYKAFEEAAEHFQPYIKFFATFDKGVSICGPPWELTDSTTRFPVAQAVPRFNIRLQVLICSVPVICGVHIWICPCGKIKGHFCIMEAGPDLGLETSPIKFVGAWLWPCSASVLETSSVESFHSFITKERSIHILLTFTERGCSETEQAPWPGETLGRQRGTSGSLTSDHLHCNRLPRS